MPAMRKLSGVAIASGRLCAVINLELTRRAALVERARSRIGNYCRRWP